MAKTQAKHETVTTTVESVDYYLTGGDSPVFVTDPPEGRGFYDPRKPKQVRVSRVFVQMIREGGDDPIYTADVYVRHQLASGKFSNGEKLLPPRDYSAELDQFVDTIMRDAGGVFFAEA